MAERICPTCGQPWPYREPQATAATSDALIRMMLEAGADGRPRAVYEGAGSGWKQGSGRYFVSGPGGGEVARAAIDEAVQRGLIRQLPDVPTGFWCLVEKGTAL
jgi:hypothetical protein